jgi:MFS superfamily sulfate permease-like transporter
MNGAFLLAISRPEVSSVAVEAEIGLTVAVTMASFYIPMALSLSANLAHLPPIYGLYGFAVQPLVYALLGSCPTMAVGPEVSYYDYSCGFCR